MLLIFSNSELHRILHTIRYYVLIIYYNILVISRIIHKIFTSIFSHNLYFFAVNLIIEMFRLLSKLKKFNVAQMTYTTENHHNQDVLSGDLSDILSNVIRLIGLLWLCFVSNGGKPSFFRYLAQG